MRKLYVVLALSFVIACSKKEESKPAEPAKPAAEAPAAADPAKPVEAAAPAAAPPADPNALEEVADAPAGMPKECTDANALMKKLHACEKVDAPARASIIKAWNAAVKGSLVYYAKASDADKKTITGSCETMVKTTTMLTKDC